MKSVAVSLSPEEFNLIVDSLPSSDEGNKLKKELSSIKANQRKGNEVLNKMEEEYPETMDLFKKVLAEEYNLFAKKQADYGPGNISMNGNKDLAILGLGVRMNDKTQRILNLAYNKNDAQNESLEDSFRDISIYGIIAQIVLNDKWGK
tara:strand:+ start:2271 stop:2714 length:444 start_codon:yes stop_codon:yes gene_type:complete